MFVMIFPQGRMKATSVGREDSVIGAMREGAMVITVPRAAVELS